MLQSITGAVQSGLGQLMGDNKGVQEGEAKKAAAAAEDERSHAAAKLGPFTATGEGGAHVDSKDRQQGAFDQTIGSGKQFVGGLVGSESLKAQGREQYNQGVQRETAGQANDLVEGFGNRISGALGSALSSDKDEQETYKRQHDDGKAAVRSVQHDLQKKVDAEEKLS
ncbi:hypothetical protein ABW19_dt0201559 [Dactylella cylindrospora]|nr:hypothetical protein ABW19_dt0201559 [Dactylella cylindrospora]